MGSGKDKIVFRESAENIVLEESYEEKESKCVITYYCIGN